MREYLEIFPGMLRDAYEQAAIFLLSAASRLQLQPGSPKSPILEPIPGRALHPLPSDSCSLHSNPTPSSVLA